MPSIASTNDRQTPPRDVPSNPRGAREVLASLAPEVAALRQAIPEVWSAYADIHRAALGEGALSAKTKELIAIAVGITRGCDGCIASHARGAARRGASEAEVAEAIGVAVLMNGGPATVYGPRAFAAFSEFAGSESAGPKDADGSQPRPR